MKKFDWLEKLRARLQSLDFKNFKLPSLKIPGRKKPGQEHLASDLPGDPLSGPSVANRDSSFNNSKLADAFKSDVQVQSLKKNLSFKKPPLEDYYPYILGAFIGFAGADLAVMKARSFLLPDTAPPAKKRLVNEQFDNKSISEYASIAARNLFDENNLVPKELNSPNGNEEEEVSTDGPATPSRLPIKLLGTIVHLNGAKSVATFEVRAGSTKILPYIPNDDVEGLAKLIRVERRKVFIRNLSNRRLEYIEMKLEGGISFGKISSAPKVEGGIKKQGNNFTVSKKELTKQLENLPELLQQARAIPYRDPDTGAIAGFKVMDIEPDSIIGQLVEVGDVIKSVNGTVVNSAAKAMELYRTLKDSDGLSLTVERNGRDETMEYNIQ
ncbi:MAG: hypothetical protein AB8E15_03170 [Bdellovibrionales bacterium]